MTEFSAQSFPLLSQHSPHWEFLPVVDSTNQYLKDSWQGYPNYSAVFSLNQTDGRGRRGRKWLSVPGETLAMSILVPISSQTPHKGILPLIAGAAVLDALRELGIEHSELKWPNDILVSGRKISGVLCETLGAEFALVGLGINLRSTHSSLNCEDVVSLQECGLAVENLLDPLLARIVELLSHYWAGGQEPMGAKSAQDFFGSRMGTIGRRVHIFQDEGHQWFGVAQGLDESGRLLVRPDSGEEARALFSADVEHLRE